MSRARDEVQLTSFGAVGMAHSMSGQSVQKCIEERMFFFFKMLQSPGVKLHGSTLMCVITLNNVFSV